MESQDKKTILKNKTFWFFLCIIVFVFINFSPPQNKNFPKTITVKRGDTVNSISRTLYKEGIVRSKTIFKAFVILSGGEKVIVQGDYLFDKPLYVFDVAKRFTKTLFGIDRITLTIPEGYTREQIKSTAEKVLPNFDGELFLQKTEGKEGYLFPDTYKFFPSANEDTVIDVMEKNFKKKTQNIFETHNFLIKFYPWVHLVPSYISYAMIYMQ
jgi:UPF0755 protein